MRAHLLVLLMNLSISLHSLADCSSPTAVAGQLQWITADSKVKFCNGSSWIDTSQSTGASCVGTPTGTINFASGDVRYCNGTNWINMKGAALTSCAGETDGTLNYHSGSNVLRVCYNNLWYDLSVAATGGPPPAGTANSWVAKSGAPDFDMMSMMYSFMDSQRPVAWNGANFIAGGAPGMIPFPAQPSFQSYNMVTKTWTNGTDSTGTITPQTYPKSEWTGSKLISWGYTYPGLASTVAVYDSGTNSWTQGAAYANSRGAPGVWTGTVLIVWGGATGSNVGGRYTPPPTNTWAAVQTTGAPSGRSGHSIIWNGTVAIIWGGTGDGGSSGLNDGKRYNPSTNAWTTTTNTGANVASARYNHTALLVGTKMYVWGGQSDASTYLKTGAIYDLSANTWAAMATPAMLSVRANPTLAWTGSKLVVFGGKDSTTTPLTDGAVYDPATNTWIAMPSASLTATDGVPCASGASTSYVMIHCGNGMGVGIYDPATNTWLPGPDSAYIAPNLVWSGTYLYRWSGMVMPPEANMNKVQRYDFSGNTWTALADSTGTLDSRAGAASFWTGSKALFWGGGDMSNNYFNDGALYDPATDTWSAMSATNAPPLRSHFASASSGTKMLIWGGLSTDGTTSLGTGALYDYATNAWVTTPIGGSAPSARHYHTAVYVNSRIIVWGGADMLGNYFNNGASFDPATNTWAAFSAASPPTAREHHSAVSTGTKMIIWGGWSGSAALANGKVWDSGTGNWTSMATSGAPSARSEHIAIWTGTKMIIWGGTSDNGTTYLNDGAVYIPPPTNTWTAMTNTNAPVARQAPSNIWVGTQMLIWGGAVPAGATFKGDGAMYTPP